MSCQATPPGIGRDSVAVRRLANLVTLRDSHSAFFAAAGGQIPMAADNSGGPPLDASDGPGKRRCAEVVADLSQDRG